MAEKVHANVALIVAMANNGVIGSRGGTPWYLPADLRHFKEVTMGHAIIMGRISYLSIGRLLPGRRSIIISRDTSFEVPGADIARSIDEALKLVKVEPKTFVIGGAEIFRQMLPYAATLHVTYVHADIPGDVVFRFNPDEWYETGCENHKVDEQNPYPYSFVTYQRRT